MTLQYVNLCEKENTEESIDFLLSSLTDRCRGTQFVASSTCRVQCKFQALKFTALQSTNTNCSDQTVECVLGPQKTEAAKRGRTDCDLAQQPRRCRKQVSDQTATFSAE